LWGYFDDDELGATVAANSARQASDSLVGQARARAHHDGDNISLIVIKLLAAPPPRKKAKVTRPTLRAVQRDPDSS
jgi:hypothetical protein